MRRYAVLVVLAALAGLVIGAVAVEAAPQPKPPTPVEVTNDAANAVPVDGQVVVANDATSPVPVEVTNSPDSRTIVAGVESLFVNYNNTAQQIWLGDEIVVTDLVLTTTSNAVNPFASDPDCNVFLTDSTNGNWLRQNGDFQFHFETGIPMGLGGRIYVSQALPLPLGGDGSCEGYLTWTGYTVTP